MQPWPRANRLPLVPALKKAHGTQRHNENNDFKTVMMQWLEQKMAEKDVILSVVVQYDKHLDIGGNYTEK